MSTSEVATLIGSGFRPIHTDPAPDDGGSWADEVHEYNTRFISGQKTRFVTDTRMTRIMLEAFTVHHEALRERERQHKQVMLTLNVNKAQQGRFMRALDNQVRVMRNFIVSEVAVFEMALSTAVEESKDVLEQLTGSKVESMQLGRITKAAEALVELHMVNKLASVLKVSPNVRRQVMEQIGSTDGNRKNVLDMQAIHDLLASRKGADKQMRRVEEAQGTNTQQRNPGGAGAIRSVHQRYTRPR